MRNEVDFFHSFILRFFLLLLLLASMSFPYYVQACVLCVCMCLTIAHVARMSGSFAVLHSHKNHVALNCSMLYAFFYSILQRIQRIIGVLKLRSLLHCV